MKRKLLTVLMLFFAAVGCAVGFAACVPTDNGDGGENPPQVELQESDAPIDIQLHCSPTSVFVFRAVYDENGTVSPYTEYKLDDGEWVAAKKSGNEAEFNGLTPVSSHTLYARCGAHG